MNKTLKMIAGLIIAVVIVASAFGASTLLNLEPSVQPSAQPTQIPTMQSTATPTNTASSEPSAQITSTPLPTSSGVPTTPSNTAEPTNSPTSTAATTSTPTSTPNPTIQPPKQITYVDAEGQSVTVTTPVTRIASLNSGITELICAIGAQDKLVGRSAGCLYPPSVKEVTIVGDSARTPNLELLLEQEPEILFADTMISSQGELLQKIKDAGILVIIEQPGNFSRLPNLVTYLGNILNEQEKAAEIVNYITYYVDLVHTQIATLSEDQKPIVYFEMSFPWRSTPANSVREQYLIETGGINLNAGSSGSTVTPEFVASANPAIIVRMISSDSHVVSDFESIWNEIMGRSQLKTTDAIKNSKVYIYDSSIFTGLRYPIGVLTWAKWFHPDLFSDIDINFIHQELNQKFYGLPLEGVYIYP